MAAEMRDNRDGYNGEGDAGQQQKRCGTTEMAKRVGRTVTDSQISIEENYQPDGVSLLQDNGDGRQGQR